MRLLRPLSVPLALLLLVAGPVAWYFPAGFPSWRSVAAIAAWAGYGLLLASLLLMLREVRISRWLGGVEHMTLWHHYVGIAAYLLLLCHPALLLLDGWRHSAQAGLAAIWPQPPGVLIVSGWAALLCMMAGLLATFLYKLPYRLWRLLHGLLGVAVLVGGAHILLLDADPLAWLLMLLSAAALAVRIVRIDVGLSARRYSVTQVAQVAPDVIEITLQPVEPLRPPDVPVKAGELVFAGFRWRTLFGGTGEFHPFTVSGDGPGGTLRIGIKALGAHTKALQQLPVGAQADIQGAYTGFLSERPPVPQLWMAGGIGITPFLAELRSTMLVQPTRLIYLAHSRRQAAYIDELEVLAHQQPQLQLQVVFTEGRRPALETLLPDPQQLAALTCYLCGPPGLTDQFIRALHARGAPDHHIHFERFDYR